MISSKYSDFCNASNASKKTKRITSTFVLILIAAAFFGCRSSSNAENNSSQPRDAALIVSAAVSLKEAFVEIGALYKTKTGETVNFNFAASGALQRQIETGAPVDVFASAGAAQMDSLAAKNLIDADTRRDFARNTLILIQPQSSKIDLSAFADLTRGDVKKIAAGNPKTVPAGEYCEQVFAKMNLKQVLQPKLIYAEDVRQVLDYVVREEVDAGIVYRTDALNAGGKVRIAAEAPPDSHAPILYPLAVIRDSRRKPAAQKFVELVLSAEGQEILKKHGFAAAF